MSDAIITVILTQVAQILEQQIRQEVRLVSGVKKEIKKLESEFKSIKAVLSDAETRQVNEAETVKLWLEKLKEVAYETEDVLSEWMAAMRKAEIEGEHSSSSPTTKVCSLVSLPCIGCFNRVALRRDIALKIKEINQKLTFIAAEKERYNFSTVPTGIEFPVNRHITASFVDASEVQGREVDKKTLVSKLLSADSNGLNVVSIVGLGGIGKTTLAQLAYSHNEVIQKFDRRVWVCVSEPFDEVRIAKAILEDIEGGAPFLFELETLARKIRFHLEGKKFLLVLDDVWTEDFTKWEQLFSSLAIGAAGSTILVTTRNERVAEAMKSSFKLSLGELSDHDSRALFKKIAFHQRSKEECERLDEVGKKIADKCKGRPLTVKTIGSLVRFKNTLKEWQDVLYGEFWEWKEAQGLFPPLMFSYYDLPSIVKRCFSFCAVFPKDHVIESKTLIQLWMAQGYLSSSSSNEDEEMEVIGQVYLQNLAMRSFFQDLVKEKDGQRILSLKMHDMVHDLAQYLTKNECKVLELNSNGLDRKMSDSTRHLTMVRPEDTNFPDVNNVNVKNLFTLWIQSFNDSPPILSQLDRVDPDLIRRLACIRALDLSRNRIGEIPKEIGNLIKLKYLNLSHNPFWELPQTLSDLFNLQTLILAVCDHLRKLPGGMGKLVDLRHLDIDRTDSLKTLPKGIGKLQSLHMLNKFVVVRGNGTCGMEDLKDLNNLRGFLRIEGLGCVGGADEAKRAELKKKIHLSDLHMDFSNTISQSDVQDEVIEALEVHEYLQSLQISSFGGSKFPNWMMNLTNLQKLSLQDCQNCANLPALGRLPSLVTLNLEGMSTVKGLGIEFLGVCANEDNDNMNGEGGSQALVAFPKLKKLKISKMGEWEEWNLIIPDKDITIMPRLRCLKILQCGRLKALPPFLLQAPLGKLRIHSCQLLQQLYSKENEGEWSKISHISKIRIS